MAPCASRSDDTGSVICQQLDPGFAMQARRQYTKREQTAAWNACSSQGMAGSRSFCAVSAPNLSLNHFCATGSAAKSELYVSTMHFHLPSACFFQISTSLPLSCTPGPPFGSLIVNSYVP